MMPQAEVAVRAVLATAALLGATSAFSQPGRQPEPLSPGTSGIRGTVIDSITKTPIEGCEIRAGSLSRGNGVKTGANGAYEFSGIPEGSYFLTVECASYAWTCLQPDPNQPVCSDITVFRDQQRANVDFRAAPGATVRGRVIDSTGKSVAKATVRIGGPFLGNTLIRVEQTVTKDDGSFELGRLPAAPLALEVEVPPGAGSIRSPVVYYPGVLKRDEAGRVETEAGKVTEGVVITVPPVLDRSLTVRIPPPDATMTEVSVSVIRAEPLMTRRVDIDAEGQAVIKGLIDGHYVVMATAMSGQERWVDYQAVDFLEESIELALQLRPVGRIRGRVIADKGGVPPLGGATIAAAWVDYNVILNPLSPEEGAVGLDGTFEIEGVFGHRKLQLGRFDPGWTIYSVTQGRSDVTESGVNVVPGNTTEVTIIVRPR